MALVLKGFLKKTSLENTKLLRNNSGVMLIRVKRPGKDILAVLSVEGYSISGAFSFFSAQVCFQSAGFPSERERSGVRKTQEASERSKDNGMRRKNEGSC